MTIKTRGQGQTDRPTDIATYRAAIAAKNLRPQLQKLKLYSQKHCGGINSFDKENEEQ